MNNRGRIMLFANLCAGAAGNTAANRGRTRQCPAAAAWLSRCCGPAGIPARRKPPGCGWMCRSIEGADRRPIREEFVSGTRLGVHESFRLSHEAVAGSRRSPFAAPRPRHACRCRTRWSMPAPCDCCRRAANRTSARSTKCVRGHQAARAGHRLRRDARHRQPLRRHGEAFTGRAVTHTLAFRHLAGRPLSARPHRARLQCR